MCDNRARAISHRQENNEAVGGFFSQIGDLYVVHHLWGEFATTLCQGCPFVGACLQSIPFQRAAVWDETRPSSGTADERPLLWRNIGPVRVACWYILSLHAAYENLQSRQETRNSAWQKDGWDSTVYYTGRRMEWNPVSPVSTPKWYSGCGYVSS